MDLYTHVFAERKTALAAIMDTALTPPKTVLRNEQVY